MTSRTLVSAPALLLLTVVLLSGCGATKVSFHEPPLTPALRARCAQFAEAAPARLSGQPRRKVASRVVAAWGDPAIVVRCGVGKPAGFNKFALCQRANGIDWFVPTAQIGDQSRDVLLTTIGRTPAIELSLPARYRPPVDAMVELVKDIRAHTTKTGGCV